MTRRRVIIMSAVALMFVATPHAYGRYVEGEHPRDEAAYIDALRDFTCHFACARTRTQLRAKEKSLRQEVSDNPQPFIAAGDKACAWLEDQDTRWDFLWFGPKVEDLSGRLYVETFGEYTSQVTPDPRMSPEQLWTEVFHSWQTREAWTHLCGDALKARSTWPQRDWYEDTGNSDD